jgi:hypothetical protein
MKNKHMFKGHWCLLLMVFFLCVLPCKEFYYAQADSKEKIKITEIPGQVKAGVDFTLKVNADIPNDQYLWVQVCTKTGKNERELFVLEQITRKPKSGSWEITFSIKDKSPKYEVKVIAVEEKSNKTLKATHYQLMKGPKPISPYVCPKTTNYSEPGYIWIE